MPPSGKERAADWRGLETERQLHISFEDMERYSWIFLIHYFCLSRCDCIFSVDFCLLHQKAYIRLNAFSSLNICSLVYSFWKLYSFISVLPEILTFLCHYFAIYIYIYPYSLCLGRPVCDVAISGLGWISVEPMSKSKRLSGRELEEAGRELHLTVHVPKPVEVFVRPPIPVGKAGAEWYQYRELTEKEEEVRPKWYFWSWVLRSLYLCISISVKEFCIVLLGI